MVRAILGCLAGVTLLAAGAAVSPAEASWFRNTVSGGFTTASGLRLTVPFGSPARVDDGVEFEGEVFVPEAQWTFGITVDVSTSDITIGITSSDPAARLATSAALLTITLGGLDGAHPVTLVSGLAPLGMVDNLPTGFVVSLSRLQDGDTYIFAIPVEEVGVPEPGSLGLLAVGAVGLGAALRRRQRRPAKA